MKNNYIKIDALQAYNNVNDIQINGDFTISNDDKNIQDINEKIIKHITLIVTRSANYQSTTPFSDVLVFKDDVDVHSNIVTGAFNIKLSDHIKFNGKGEYYIMCSLGVYLSNTLTITVTN